MIDASALDEALRCPWVWKAVVRCVPYRNGTGALMAEGVRAWMIDAETRQRIYVAYRRIVINRQFGIELVPEAA